MPELNFVDLGNSIPVISFTITQRMNEVGTMDVVVPGVHIRDLDLYLEKIELWDNGELLFYGSCKSSVNYPEFNEGVSNATQIKLKCDDAFGWLVISEPVQVHYQNTQPSVILAALLATCPYETFSISDTINLNDGPITIDLRSADSLWTQIVAVLETSRRQNYMRNVGIDNAGIYLVEIGFFREQIDSNFAILGKNIVSRPEFAEPDNEPILSILPISGDSVDEPVSLQDALNIDPTLDDPSQDYQIVGDRVVNNTITRGMVVRRDYSVVKTEGSDPPTQTELDQAAVTLYYSAAKDLEASKDKITVTVNAVMSESPQLYDACWLDTFIYEPLFDPICNQYTYVQSFFIRRWLRIAGITIDYRERHDYYDEILCAIVPKRVYKLELTNSDRRNKYDVNLQLFEKIKDQENLNTGDAILASQLGYKRIRKLSVQQTGGATDCLGTGHQFVFDHSAIVPATASGVVTAVTSISQGYEVTSVVQAASVDPYADLILCVEPIGGSWTVADSATVKVTFSYL